MVRPDGTAFTSQLYYIASRLYRLTRLALADLFAPELVWISTQIAGITGAQSQAVEQELATLDSSGNSDRIGGEAVGSDHEREPREADPLKTLTLRRQILSMVLVLEVDRVGRLPTAS